MGKFTKKIRSKPSAAVIHPPKPSKPSPSFVARSAGSFFFPEIIQSGRLTSKTMICTMYKQVKHWEIHQHRGVEPPTYVSGLFEVLLDMCFSNTCKRNIFEQHKKTDLTLLHHEINAAVGVVIPVQLKIDSLTIDQPNPSFASPGPSMSPHFMGNMGMAWQNHSRPEHQNRILGEQKHRMRRI